MAQEMSVEELRRLAALHKGLTPESWLMDWAATEIERLRNQVAAGLHVVNAGVDLMSREQVGRWAGVRSFLEQVAEDYEPLDGMPSNA